MLTAQDLIRPRRCAESVGAAGFRPFRQAPIRADERLAGVVVVVPPEPPFRIPARALRADPGAASPLVTLVRRRGARRDRDLRTGATPACGRWKTRRAASAPATCTARAPADGRDEVAAVASAFNAMAADLASRADALAAADRARRQLLADVSHELTTPVTAMRGYLETLSMPDFPLDEATRARYLGIIGDETSRLERIIGDLLELARLEGGGGSLHVEPVPVEQLFERVVARHERAPAAAAQVTHRARRSSRGAEIVRGRSRPARTGAAEPGGQRAALRPARTAVELRAARRGERGRASPCATQGPGIAPEHLPHLFDRFYKAECRARPSARARRQRQRPRPVDRQGDRRAARRHASACAASRGEPSSRLRGPVESARAHAQQC